MRQISCQRFCHRRIYADSRRHRHRLDRVDPSQLQFFRQTILQRPKRTLRTAPRLRRVRRDVLDAELLQGTAELRQNRPRYRPAALRREEVVAAPVSIELTEQTVLRNHVAHPVKARCRALLIHQKR